ncbi:MAG: Na/Pi cotransporter family protein [Desulfitobacteriia bacterium]|jgi:phosphate:Na+ symporter
MLMPLLTSVFGLFLLLAGMYCLREGLKRFAGSSFQNLLHTLTLTPSKGFLSGIAVTTFLQSSTALTVMTVSFVDAELMYFENALALILGSNIGSTATPQLLTLPLDRIAIWLIFFGLSGFCFVKTRIRYLFLSLGGLGIMFFSLAILEMAMIPITDLPWVDNQLHQLHNNYLYAIAAGTALSAAMHSSSAATGIAMLLTEEGFLTLPAALAFILGVNIGTCFTAIFVSFFASRAAQKVALFHLLVNIAGVILCYPLLEPFAALIAILSDDLGRQVANGHTIFNILSSLLFLPFIPLMTKLLNKLR